MEFHKLNVFTGGSFQVEDLSRIVEEALTFKNKVYPDFLRRYLCGGRPSKLISNWNE